MRRERAGVPPTAPGAGARGAPRPPSAIERLQQTLGNRAFARTLGAEGERDADRKADAALHVPVDGSSTATYGHPDGPLPAGLRGEMEKRFGTDFSDVRVHTGPEAADSARALNAQAYTVGRDVVFAAGRFAPEAPHGKQLLAHELAHVVQQRATGPMVQRKETSEPAVGETIDFQIGPFDLKIATLEQLGAASRFMIEQLEEDLRDLDGASPARAAARAWIEQVEPWQQYLKDHGSDKLSPYVASNARRDLADLVNVRRQILMEKADAKEQALLHELRRTRAEAEEAAHEARRLQPELADRAREAYRSEKPSRIKEAIEVMGTASGVSKDMLELGEQVTEAMEKLHHFVQGAHGAHATAQDVEHVAKGMGEVSSFSKLMTAVTYIAKGFAAVNLALAAKGGEAKATELEEGMENLQRATEAFGSLSVLLAVAPHIGLYTHLYIAPMLKKIMKQLEHLVDQLHDENTTWVKVTGELGYPGAEPGKDPMFQFMRAVMRAENAEDVPAIPDAVREYLLAHREAIDAGASEEMPTRGWWFWRSYDAKKGREWVFENRRAIWAMFYGSMAREKE